MRRIRCFQGTEIEEANEVEGVKELTSVLPVVEGLSLIHI